MNILSDTCSVSVFNFNMASAEKEKVIELKFASHIPPGIPVNKSFEQWAKRLEE